MHKSKQTSLKSGTALVPSLKKLFLCGAVRQIISIIAYTHGSWGNSFTEKTCVKEHDSIYNL